MTPQMIDSSFLDLQGTGLLPVWEDELDFARMICESGEYTLKMFPFPPRTQITIPGYETRTGTLTVKSKSYLTAVTFWTELASGVFVMLFDKGSQSYLVNEQFVPGGQWAGSLELGQTEPVRQNWINGPYLVSGSGELQVSITNNGATAGLAQAMFFFAEKRGN